MICFLWCHSAKLNWKVLQTVFQIPSFSRATGEETSLCQLINGKQLTLKNDSEQGVESAFAGKWEKRFFTLLWMLNMKPGSANTLSCAKLHIVVSCSWGISIAAPELRVACSAGCTSTLGGQLAKLIWQGHGLNPIWFGDCQPPSQDLRASLCQIIICSLKPSCRHGPLIHPFQRGSRFWI